MCVSNRIVSTNYLASSHYLKRERFSVFSICKKLLEDHEHIRTAKIVMCSDTQCCDLSYGYTAIYSHYL